MATTNLKNFGLHDAEAIVLTATTAGTARAELPNAAVDDLMIINAGIVTVFVRTGDVTVTADATAMPILAGEKGVYARGIATPPVTHIAAFVASGTQDITIVQGSGV